MAAGTVERAFQIAPECKTMDEVRARLSKEGCLSVEAHIQGSLMRQLKKLLDDTGQDCEATSGTDRVVDELDEEPVAEIG